MKFDILMKSSLFSKIDKVDLKSLIQCLSANEKEYQKNEYIFRAGEKASLVGIIMKGSVNVIKEEFWGNRTILENLGVGDLFGEAFSCAKMECLPISVVTAEDSEVLLIDYKRVINYCSNSCVFHGRLIENMMTILASKNIKLTQKMEHMSQRTTREKLLSYLSSQAQRAGSNSFMIPFNRQELADYLSVDRSAMSSELSKMREEGIVSFSRNSFELKKGGRDL